MLESKQNFSKMKLQTQMPLYQAEGQIDYASQLLLLGSCFSENIGAKLDYFKFQTVQNPFGILFHPLAIENLISRAVNKEYYTDEELLFLNERWHCFDAHSDLSHVAKEKVLHQLNTGISSTRNQLLRATHIAITLGTAWTYLHKEANTIVANCHKVPQTAFEKQILSVEEIASSLENMIHQIKTINTKAQIIFTISPVRHLKDGFVENQRSKAHLITAIHNVWSPGAKSRGICYFESYELLMDELRDYRFYKADMVHPNELAIDYIWDKFQEVWITDEAKETMKMVHAIQQGLQHRAFNPNSEQHMKFKKTLQDKISYINKEYPFMRFS